MKKAIVTGATGAIGNALVRELISKGIEVLVIARNGSPRNSRIPEHSLIKVCLCGLEQIKNLRNEYGEKYDVFFHLGWVGTAASDRDDVRLQNKNIEYCLDAVEMAKRFGCDVFVGAGSQAEYGPFEGVLTPDTPVFPKIGYGMAKLCAGQLTRLYCCQLGIRHVWVRILSAYGPYDNQKTMIMSTINSFLKEEKPLFTKGEQLWDYIFSEDAARAFYLLGEMGKNGKTYVLGSGKSARVSEYVKIIRDIVAPDIQLEFGTLPYAPSQVMHLEADISDITEDTGFLPRVDFQEGIKKTLEFCLKV